MIHKNMSNLFIIMGYSGKGENYIRNYRRDLGKLNCQCRLEGLAQDFNSAEDNGLEQSGQKQWGGNFSKLLSMDGSSLSQWTQHWQLLDSVELPSRRAGHTKGRRLASYQQNPVTWKCSPKASSTQVPNLEAYCKPFLFLIYWSTADLQCCVSFSDSAKGVSLHIHISILFRFSSHTGHYRVLSTVLCAIQQVLISDLFYI